MAKFTKGELEIIEGIKIYITPTEADEIICEIPYDYAKDFNKTEQELLANAKELVRRWNSQPDLYAACKRGHQRLLEMGQKESHRTVSIMKAALAKADVKDK